MEGLVFNTNNSGTCIVVNYTNYDDVTVKFVETGYETKTRSLHDHLCMEPNC